MKVAYTDEDQARDIAERMSLRHPGQTFVAYVCRYTPSHFHIGHPPTERSSYC